MSGPVKRASVITRGDVLQVKGPTSLSLVTASGARVRRHKYFRDLRTFLPYVLLAAVLQAAIYLFIVIRAGRSDWQNMAIVVAAASMVPLVSASTLSAFRRHEAPIMVAGIVSIVLTTFFVAFLSAARIPMSYTGLIWSLPVFPLILSYANLRFHRSVDDRVAILPFYDARWLQMLLGGNVPILSSVDADLSDVDAVLIDPKEHLSEKWLELLTRCHMGHVEIIPWPLFIETRLGRVDIQTFDISHITYSPSQTLYARTKRVLDIAAVIVMLPLTLPLACIVGLYILLRDGRPVLFVQNRRGYGGHLFRLYKFRTMYNGLSGGSTANGDKRIIPGCHLIRRLRLDELPQLYNVLVGEMSLIGPRPVAEYVAHASMAIEPKYEIRTLIRPGLTGWAQVTSGYAETVEEEIEKLSYDLYYIKRLSFDLDLLIIFRTVKTLLLGTGAR